MFRVIFLSNIYGNITLCKEQNYICYILMTYLCMHSSIILAFLSVIVLQLSKRTPKYHSGVIMCKPLMPFCNGNLDCILLQQLKYIKVRVCKCHSVPQKLVGHFIKHLINKNVFKIINVQRKEKWNKQWKASDDQILFIASMLGNWPRNNTTTLYLSHPY